MAALSFLSSSTIDQVYSKEIMTVTVSGHDIRNIESLGVFKCKINDIL